MNRYEALKHAVKAHAGQLDKCGQPYILHPIAVAEAVEQAETLNTGPHVIVALLHDVLEGTDYEPPVSDTERWRLEKLTCRSTETYSAYIDRICNSWGADGIDEVPMIVKLADLWHNLSPERQDCLPEKERRSLEARYLKARDRIWEALGDEWWPEMPERAA
jgi:(p)ppGpp synthase/HD superfamily hydrolase